MSIYKTGIISISVLPKFSDIYLDDEAVKASNKFNRSQYNQNLRPGYYNIKVVKEGYVPWEKSVKIESGIVNSYTSVFLFLNNIEPQILTDKNKIDLLFSPNDTLAIKKNNKSLVVNGTEIWLNDQLVTRFSTQILNLSFYNDDNHILYQISNEIRVMDADGSNHVLLATLKDSTPTQFAISGDGCELYYRDASDFFLAKIR